MAPPRRCDKVVAMDIRGLLQLQSDWGVDECLLAVAQDRRGAAPVVGAPRRPPMAAPPARGAAMPDLEACRDLAALDAALQGFGGCALRETASTTVSGEGPAGARVMLVGDAPGAEEDRAGRPFVGPAGLLLTAMLGSIGLRREEVRLSYVVPWRPPGDRPPSAPEIAACLPFLQREIALVAPEVVVVLGAIAARALLGDAARGASISRLRGVWTTLQVPGRPPCPALPCFHPLYLLRTPAAKAQAWADLLSLRARLESAV
jgi:DNA polymerase